MFFRRSPKKAIKEDEELLALYRETGEMAHLGELYDRYMHLVFGVCLKYLKDKEESKDMVMQIFEKLRVELRKQDVKNFKSWLHVLSKNECLMLLRSAKYKSQTLFVESSEDLDMESGYLLHPEVDDDLELDLQELEKAVEILPPEQKTCIKLFFIEQKCYKELVELTGYDLKKIKSYIQNGKRNLKIHLQKNEHQ